VERFTNMRVILAQGHANLLCIVPPLSYVPPERVRLIEVPEGSRGLALQSAFSMVCVIWKCFHLVFPQVKH